MAMMQTPLLMSNILDRGARVSPKEEIVTATEAGVRRQTYKETRDRAHQLAHALANAGIDVGDRVARPPPTSSAPASATSSSCGRRRRSDSARRCGT